MLNQYQVLYSIDPSHTIACSLLCVTSFIPYACCAADGQQIPEHHKEVQSLSNEAFVLSLPGKCLDVLTLVNKKNKRNFGRGVAGKAQLVQ